MPSIQLLGDCVYSDAVNEYYIGCTFDHDATLYIHDHAIVETKEHFFIGKVHSVFVEKEPVRTTLIEFQVLKFSQSSNPDEISRVLQTLEFVDMYLDSILALTPVQVHYIDVEQQDVAQEVQRLETLYATANTAMPLSPSSSHDSRNTYDYSDPFIDNRSHISDGDADEDEDDTAFSSATRSSEYDSEESESEVGFFYFTHLDYMQQRRLALEPMLLDHIIAFAADHRNLESEQFNALKEYVCAKYALKSIEAHPRYAQLVAAISKPNEIDLYEFYHLIKI